MKQAWQNRMALLLAVLLIGGLWLRAGLLYVNRAAVVVAAGAVTPPHVLIDPGHGGEDGGASGADGTLEKDLNLAVSLPLCDLLRLLGYSVTMVRETDCAVYDPETVAVYGKKVSDMRNRLAMYEQAETVISLHQNHFSQAKYSGTQVFYSAARPESKALAQRMQQAVRTYLQPQNHREIKAAGENIYLLHSTTRPAVLVECGFLSNEAEREALKTEEYRQKLALTLASVL